MATLKFMIDANGSDAARVMDRLRARAEELDRQLKSPMRLNVDDKVAAAKLLRTRLAADKLRARLDMDLTVRGTVAAEARLLELEHTADRLRSKMRGGGLLGRLGGIGSALSGAGGAVTGALGSVVSGGGDITAAIKTSLMAMAAGAAAALVPALLPAVTGAGVALGGIFAGAMLDKGFRARLAGLGKTLESVLGRAVQPVTRAFTGMIPGITRWAKSMEGPLRRAFAASAPYLRTFVRVLEQSAQILLPAITRMMKRFTPFLPALAQGLTSIVQGIADFFDELSPQAMSGAVTVFVGIAGAIGIVLRVAGKLVTWAAQAPGAILGGLATIVHGFRVFADGVLNAIGAIINGAADAFSWLPDTGKRLRTAANAFDRFRGTVETALGGAETRLRGWQRRVNNLPKIIKLRGDITDLASKLATAQRQLKDPNLTKTRRAKIEARIGRLMSAYAKAKAALDRLDGRVVTTYITAVRTPAGSYVSGGRGGHPLATGGLVRGPGGPTADKAGLFRLSNGEFVMRAAAVRQYGMRLLSAMNVGTARLPGLAAGGPVSTARPAPVTVVIPGDTGRARRAGPLVSIGTVNVQDRADVELLARRVAFGLGI